MSVVSVIDTMPTTRDRLAAAALAEFNWAGYEGTNSNKIARAAGFAPQTFYRTFDNKLEAFLAAYQEWQREEWYHLEGALADQGKHSLQIAEVLLNFHRDYAVFRASLIKLAADHHAVAEARAASRQRQISRIAEGFPAVGDDPSRILAALLSVEAITDGVALGLFEAYADDDSALGLIADAVQPLMPIGQ